MKNRKTIYWIAGGAAIVAALFAIYWFFFRPATYLGGLLQSGGKLLFEDMVTPKFAEKVKEISRDLNINPNWLMAIMYNESRFDHTAVNSIGAVGLIQFIPSTAIQLGTNPRKLLEMSAVEQLDYVKKYYSQSLFNGKLKSYIDTAMATFYPVAIGKEDGYIIGSHKGAAEIAAVANSNSGMDINMDGKITVADFKNYALKNFNSRQRSLLT